MDAKEIVAMTFEKAKIGGYKIEEVDKYLHDVSVEFKSLSEENAELQKKLEVLAGKIREYREEEDALREALLVAKIEAKKIENAAKEEAERINKEAKEKADKTMKDADALAASRKEQAEKNLADANAKAKKTVDDANAKAEGIVAEANRKADEIHTIMMQQTEREQIILQRTRKEVAEYTSKILAAYNSHIDFIKGIPAQCENEFVVNTAKTVENRKPSESAFAKKEEPKKAEPVKEEPKKEEAKPAEAPAPEVKEEAKPAEAPAPEAKEEAKPAEAPAPEVKEEEKKEENKAENEKTGLFFSLKDKKN